MRPALKDKFVAEDRARRDVVKRILARSAREAVFVFDEIDWHRLGAAMLGGH